MQKSFDTKYGKVSVRNIMMDYDDHCLEEGIIIQCPEYHDLLIEVLGYIDLTHTDVSTIEKLIEENIKK